MKQKNQKFKTALSSAKIEIKILKSLKLASLKQQEFFNEFYFQFFNAYETDVRKNGSVTKVGEKSLKELTLLYEQ